MSHPSTSPMIFIGNLHGVPVFLGDVAAITMPCDDLTGEKRPYVQVTQDSDSSALFDIVARARGKYDLFRQLDQLPPVNWGSPGTIQDVHDFIEKIHSF